MMAAQVMLGRQEIAQKSCARLLELDPTQSISRMRRLPFRRAEDVRMLEKLIDWPVCRNDPFWHETDIDPACGDVLSVLWGLRADFSFGSSSACRLLTARADIGPTQEAHGIA